MERHLFLTGKTELHGSLVALNSMQLRLRESRTTGLIEVKVGTARRVVLIYANGSQAGVYLLEDGQSRPFNLIELSALWGGAPFSVSSVELPDRAGRAVWLILESHRRERLEIGDPEAWGRLLTRWEAENFSGAVELVSRTIQGFIVLQRGKPLAGETVFFNGQDFEHMPPPQIGAHGNWQVVIYAPSPTSAAWRCLNLRESATAWARRVIDRYGEMSGRKFLQVTLREISQAIQPWEWKIAIHETIITDDHFFAGIESAAHAYRALFMSIGAQMSFVVGPSLTQRILTETFDELTHDQRAALSVHRLIPAAFSY